MSAAGMGAEAVWAFAPAGAAAAAVEAAAPATRARRVIEGWPGRFMMILDPSWLGRRVVERKFSGKELREPKVSFTWRELDRALRLMREHLAKSSTGRRNASVGRLRHPVKRPCGRLPAEGLAKPGVEGRGCRRKVVRACTLRSAPFGKHWRSSPLMFSFAPRCPSAMPPSGTDRCAAAVRIAEAGRQTLVDPQRCVLAHLRPLIPGQWPSEPLRQGDGAARRVGRRRSPRAHVGGRPRHPGRKRGPHTGSNPTDRSKPGARHRLLVDRRGTPLACLVTQARAHDGWHPPAGPTPCPADWLLVRLQRPRRQGLRPVPQPRGLP